MLQNRIKTRWKLAIKTYRRVYAWTWNQEKNQKYHFFFVLSKHRKLELRPGTKIKKKKKMMIMITATTMMVAERVSGCPRSLTLERPRKPWTTARTTAVLRQWTPRHCVATTECTTQLLFPQLCGNLFKALRLEASHFWNKSLFSLNRSTKRNKEATYKTYCRI